MSNSKLVTYTKIANTNNYYKGRAGAKISEITIHHVAAVVDIERVGKEFQNPARQSSAHYGVDKNGIGQYVLEEDTAYANSNWEANKRAVAIETCNSKGAPNWEVSDATLNNLIKLVADIAKRNNLGELVPGKNLTWHSMYAQTACIPTNTELLTKQGWKKLADIDIGDEIASADLDNLKITFEEVYDKVPTKIQDTYTNNELTATKDHRMIYSIQSDKKKYRIDYYGNLLTSNNNIYIPLAGYSDFEGLELTDDMIRFYVAVQADGHYMYENTKTMGKRYYGLEFHLKKERKIERIKEILDNINLAYTLCNKSDGTTSIRIFNTQEINIVEDICEKYLIDKQFSWNLINMSSEQSKIFIDELLLWDGCENANKYSSFKKQNLDMVNAICAINGIGSRVTGSDVYFRDVPYITLSHENTKRNKSGKLTEVSCVSVKTGLILIRQNGKTFIIGNCPGNYLRSKMQYIADEANKINNPKPTIIYREIERKSVVLVRDSSLWDLNFTNWADAKSVKNYTNGTKVDNIVAIATHSLGGEYYITEYSYNNKIDNGINILDCKDYVEQTIETPNQEPIEKVEPKIEVPQGDLQDIETKNIFMQIIGLLTKLINIIFGKTE